MHVLWSLEIGGAERAVFQLVREQIRTGIQADVLVGKQTGYYGARAREAGAEVYMLGQKRALGFAAWRAGPVIRRYDLAHFHSAEPLLMEVARRQPNVRLVYTHRGGLRSYGLAKRVRHSMVARCLRDFDAVSANTRQSARAAARSFGISLEHISVLYNGIDFSLLKPTRSAAQMIAEIAVPPGVLIVGTTAHLRDWKRVDRLIRAVAAPELRSTHCVVVGDGPARPELEELVRGLGISDRVTFTGRKEQVGDYLQVFDVFVLPSGPEEAFGNSLVEAMGTGIPSIVFSDGGGLLEHVSDGTTGIVVDTQADLERALVALADDPALRVALGEAARAAVRRKYSVAEMARRYLSLYQSVGAAEADVESSDVNSMMRQLGSH